VKGRWQRFGGQPARLSNRPGTSLLHPTTEVTEHFTKSIKSSDVKILKSEMCNSFRSHK
jgi:hypothetical protein